MSNMSSETLPGMALPKKMSLGTDVHPRRKVLVVVTVGGSTNSGMMLLNENK